VIDRDGKPLASSSPQGYSPAQIRHAYGFDTLSANGSGITIGIVDAYDDPTIVNDLAAFKSQFGISGCNLTKVNQNGGTKYPRVNSGWALEISLDVEWACAIAPGANILLVEASSNSNTNLYAAWIMRLSTPRWSP
jgi:subtilase family serine protease